MAYEWVQRNAMKVWDEGEDFPTLVKADEDIKGHMSIQEIETTFSVTNYLKHVDAIFERVFGRGSSERD